MLRILSDLAEDDLFGLITFSSRIQTWKPELLKATEGNVEEAKTFVKGITTGGGKVFTISQQNKSILEKKKCKRK